jgi:diguanylate cyclase (GGDEF)-like protein/PAS domain S-box-containing protein
MTDKEICSGEAATVEKQAREALATSLSLLKATMESTADGVLVVDTSGHITLWNHKFANMWHIPEELLSQHLDDLAINHVLGQMARPEEFLAKVRQLYGQPEASSTDQLTLADGRIFERYSQPQKIGDNVVGRVWSFTDITERKRAEETLLNQRLLLRTLIDNIPDSIYSKDLAGLKTLANSTEVRYVGAKTEADVIGKSDFSFYPREIAEKFLADDQLVMQTGEPVLNREEYIFDENQHKRWLLSSKLPLRNQEGRIIGLVGIGRDITARKKAEEDTRRERAFFDQLVDTAPEGIAITDPQGKVMRVNAEFVHMFGYGADEAVGQPIDDLVAPSAREQEARTMTASAGQGETNSLETVRRRRDGTLVDVSIIAAPIMIAGKLEAVYAIYRDITERKHLEHKLEEMATHDFLTGLPNRVLLLDRFTIAAALARRNKSRLAVMSLDLDKFKTINDTLGHDAGDQVLKAIGVRLTRIVRASDTFARVGGDEFISVMLGTSHIEDATIMTQKILDSFREPVSVGEHQLRLSTSIGIAIYPDDAEDLETLTKKSDAAMYYSKSHGGNQFKFYGDGDVRCI